MQDFHGQGPPVCEIPRPGASGGARTATTPPPPTPRNPDGAAERKKIMKRDKKRMEREKLQDFRGEGPLVYENPRPGASGGAHTAASHPLLPARRKSAGDPPPARQGD